MREGNQRTGEEPRSAPPNGASMDYERLVYLRQHHPAWLLLAADSAPLVIGFLHRCFIEPNVRTIREHDLIVKLDDYLYDVRRIVGEDAFPRPAADYLREWTADHRGWLRRYYPEGSDEPHFDLTPAAERAIRWVAGLEERRFVGTESRLKLVFDLLHEIAQGSETDPEVRIAELERQRAAIEREIEDIRAGHLRMLDAAYVRERFYQAVDTARTLLADFRQVEQNFRDLDRQTRERIATWDGGKGEVLEEILLSRDAIAESDEGRSFQSFWDFLMTPERQEELTALMERVMALEEIAELSPDPRLKRIHYEWLTAGEATQRTVARLSQQLRRFLDDQALLENRRIMDLLRRIEGHALAVRDAPPGDRFMEMDEPKPTVTLPMERPLFRRPVRARINEEPLPAEDGGVPVTALFAQMYVDKEKLRRKLQTALHEHGQIDLPRLLSRFPLEHGLSELVAWLSLATDDGLGAIDEERTVHVTWTGADGRRRRAEVPNVVFVRE